MKYKSGSILAIRTTKPQTVQVSSRWLDNLVLAAEVVRDGCALAPFPYLKFAASITVQLLLRIQTVQRNRDDFLDLSRKLVEVIVTMRDTLCTCFQTSSSAPELAVPSFDFVSKLLALQAQINEIVRRSNFWTSFLRSSEITEAIGRYKEQINDLRSNITLDIVVRLSLKISEERAPRQLACTSNVLYFIDAMNETVPVALDHCSSPTEFNEYVKFRFRKRMGRAIVERGYYALCLQLVTGFQQPLGPNDEMWSLLVKPGVTIAMDIVLTSELEDVETDGHRCPSCGCLCKDTSLGDEIKCSSCTAAFRIVHTTIENGDTLSDGSTPGSIAFPPMRPLCIRGQTGDECDIRYFRRFRVIMDVLGQAACVLVAEDNPVARQLLVKQLQKLQLHVIATGNGAEALAEWEARGPGYFSAALFDHHMPVCDGAEATKRLRLMESERNCTVLLPIVALSADCQDSTKQLCLSAGMNAFFSKPVKKGDFSYMLSMLREHPSI